MCTELSVVIEKNKKPLNFVIWTFALTYVVVFKNSGGIVFLFFFITFGLCVVYLWILFHLICLLYVRMSSLVGGMNNI